MAKTTELIRVPAETADALRSIAASQKTTIVAILNEMLREQHGDSIRQRGFPNASLKAVGANVMFMLGDANGITMPFELLSAASTEVLADTIDEIATGGTAKAVGDGDFTMLIGRRGRALTFMQGERRRIIATSAIPQLTAWLRSAAKEARQFEKCFAPT